MDTLPAGCDAGQRDVWRHLYWSQDGVAGGSTVTYASGATVPGGAPGSCTITANVTSSTPGTVTNTIAAGALQTNNGNNAAAATANLTVTANVPTVAKVFAPATITSGGTSVLTITLNNNNATAATLSAALVDTLPAGVTLANATFGGTCTGAKTGVAGGSTVTYASGATIPGGAPGSCTITANVTSSTPGTVTNTIAAGALQTNNGNNAAAATANLTVTANVPTVAKVFAPATITSGGTSVLTITLSNNNATAATLSAALVDTLPAGVTLANATFGGTCTGAKTGVAGGSTVTYASGATIPGGAPGSCTITANVTSSTPGTVTNTIAAGALQTNNGNNAAAATANLTVTANVPTVAKVFAPATITSGGTSVLTITLSNNNATAATLSAALVDTLPAGVTLANATFGGTCTGAKTGVAGGSTVTYASGATIPGGAPGSCTITANVTSSTPGTVTNTIAAGALQTNNGNNAAAATANLTVQVPSLTVVKTASVASAPQGGTYTYTIVVSNSGPVASAAPTTITDTVPAGLTITGLTNGAGWVCTPTTATGPATITCTSAAGVAAGASNQTVVTLNATKTSTTTVTNTASVTGGDPGCVAPLPARCTSAPPVTDSSQPSLTVVKTASVASAPQGGTYTYTIVVSNSGPVASAAPTTITDTVPAGLTITGLTNGAGWVCTPTTATGPATITCTSAAGVAAGASNQTVVTLNATKTSTTTVTNTASVTGGDPGCVAPLPARCTSAPPVTDSSQPSLTVVKTASVASAPQGGTYTYTIVVSNSGPVASAAPTTITDTVPAGLTITGLTNGAGWVCTPTTATGPATITCTSAAGVAAGASNQTVVTLNATKTSTTTVTNTASVTGGDPGCVAPLPARCTSAPPVTDSSQPSLTVVKTASVASAPQGGTYTYTIVVSNSGPVASAAPTTITDTVPAGLTITGLTNGAGWVCTPTTATGPATITCTSAAGVAAGASNQTVVTLNATKTSTTTVTNTASVTGGDPGCVAPLPARCTSAPPVTDSSQPSLTVVKTASVASAPQGGTYTYTIVVSNSGPVASAAPTTITDTVPAGLTITGLTNGAGWVCTPTTATGPATITCTSAAGVAAGASNQTVVTLNATKTSTTTVTNTASVTGGDPGCVAPLPARCTSAPPVTDSSQPSLTVVKTASVASAPQGGTYTYTIVVSNSGPVASAAPTTITDTVPAGLTITGLTNGAGWVCTPTTATGPATITCTSAAGVAAGASNQTVVTLNATKTSTTTVTNTASVTGGDPGCVAPLPARCTSAPPVTDSSQPSLTVVKTASVASAPQGGTYTYTIVVSNSGPVASAAPTTITDTVPAGLTITGLTNGAGWVCTPTTATGPATITCTSAAGVAAGASNQTVVTLNATKTSTTTVTNTASVTGVTRDAWRRCQHAARARRR